MPASDVVSQHRSNLVQWLADNWKSVAAVSAGAVVVAGVVYYVTSAPAAPKGKSEKKKSAKSAKLPAAASPLSKPKANGAQKSAETKPAAAEPLSTEVPPPKYPEKLFPENIDELSKSARLNLAKEAKTLGNMFYGESKVQDAIVMYTQAIKLSPDAVYYSNRAACFASLGKNENVVEDCNEALKLDPKYIKAMSRRALAYEQLKKFEDALNDYTVVCVLEEFRNDKTIAATDRVLKELGKQKATEIMKTKESKLPSDTFITAYMDSFRRTSTRVSSVLELTPVTDADKKLQHSYQMIIERKYQEAYDSCFEATAGDLSEQFAKLGYNLRGTFQFLRGETSLALEDFNRSADLDPLDTNTLIKRASVYMEKGEIEKAVEQFDDAQRINSEDPDLFYHRGQVRFLTGDLNGAVEDYQRSIELDGNMLYANIQLGVSQYKMGDIGTSEATFLKATRRFKSAPEIYNYHGEILLDQGKFEEAQEKFDKSIELDPISPLPYINKAILHLQWTRDLEKAEEMCIKATTVDPLCDIAYAQLAQIHLQQNRIEDAILVWDQAINVTRTEMEVMNAIQCREAARAQLIAQQKFPESLEKLRQNMAF